MGGVVGGVPCNPRFTEVMDLLCKGLLIGGVVASS